MALVKVCSMAELPPGAVMEFRMGEGVFALCNYAGQVHALTGTCPHSYGPLGQGMMNGKSIVCPWHFWGFDCETGENDYDPKVRLETFVVEVRDGEIFMDPESHA